MISALPTSAETALLDTSAALPLVSPAHQHHALVSTAVEDRRLGLAGHAAMELYSALTRLPLPHRLGARAARRLIEVNFPATHHLGAATAEALLAELPDLGISGGAVYDALVAAAAKEAGLPLISCDRRAVATYTAVGVNYRLIGP